MKEKKLKILIFDHGDTIIQDLPESFGGTALWSCYCTVDGVKETDTKEKMEVIRKFANDFISSATADNPNS